MVDAHEHLADEHQRLAGSKTWVHLLRDYLGSDFFAAGMDVKKVQYLAGHATLQMTLNVYATVVNNTPEQMAPLINSVF